MIMLIVLIVFFLFIGVFELIQSTRKPPKMSANTYKMLRILVGLFSIFIAVFFLAAILSLNFGSRFPGIFL